MRVFLTGATGFIGSRILPELIARGHEVLGLTRSDQGARALEAAGALVHRGSLEDPETLARGAAAADAVIHTAFDHDFSRFAENCEKDVRAITAMGEALVGSDRPFIITSGTAIGATGNGEIAVEQTADFSHPNPRIASERTGAEMLQRGVSVAVMRLPQVHDPRRQGLITPFIHMARERGEVAYIGDGANRWAAAHVDDVARLYALALDGHEAGARYHAVDEEGVAMRPISEAIGAGLGLPVRSITPEEAPAHFGWLAMFAGFDMPASSAWTRQRLGWQPTGPGLIEDLKAMDHQASSSPW